MDERKKQNLENAGWTVGSASEFLSDIDSTSPKLRTPAMSLEEHLIPPDRWNSCTPQIPIEARRIANNAIAEGISTGIGWLEGTGFFILMTGQGPFIAWMEGR